MEIKELKNPPIVEALLEVRFNPNKYVTAKKLEEFAESISEVFVQKQAVENQTIELVFAKGVEMKHDLSVQPSGFVLKNAAGNRVVIAAIDKFVMSFLAPYAPWPSLSKEAEKYYKQYLKFAPQTEIVRLGMRYINKIKIPLTVDFNFEKYINTFPPTPKYPGLADSISKFETLLVMPHEDIGCTSSIRQVLLGLNSGDQKELPYLDYVLDIDIYMPQNLPRVDSEDIWEAYERMRSKKNAIFFGSLTDVAIAPYE